MKIYYIKPTDVGKKRGSSVRWVCSKCRKVSTEFVFSGLLEVRVEDVGKRCYKDSERWRVETTSQFRARVGESRLSLLGLPFLTKTPSQI